MKIDFTKMTGAGNDFVVIDNRSREIKRGSRAARLLCDRRWGIGADGLILLEKSRLASYKMMYYNADGTYGGMCGNGGRCVAAYAVSLGIAKKGHTFEALNHLYQVIVGRDRVVLTMKNPRRLVMGKRISVKSRDLSVNSVDTGSPHVVIPISEAGARGGLEAVDVVRLGRTIRYHREFTPSGTNVNFIERSRGNTIRIRTYERGVEDETLACGTGSIASAIVAKRLWGLKAPVRVIPRSGVPLLVNFRGEDAITDVCLTGPAKAVFSGSFEL